MLFELLNPARNTERYRACLLYTSTYVDEMVMKFITGREPIENWDTYVAVSYTHLDVYKRQILSASRF